MTHRSTLNRRRVAAAPSRSRRPARAPKAARLLAEAREREQVNRESFELAAVGIAHVNVDGRFVEVNDALCEMLGYSRAELCTLTAIDLSLPDDREVSISNIGALLSGEIDVVTLEKRYVRKDGSLVWGSVATRVVQATRLHPRYFLAVIIDIDARKTIEHERARQANLLDHAYDAIFSWELDGPITYWNQGAARLYGYPEEEAVGRVSHDLLRSRHPVPLADYLARLRTHGFWEGEIIHVGRNGHEIEVESRAVLVRSGGQEFVIEANRDITQRARAERELQDSEEQFRTLADSLPQIIFTTDPLGACTYVNAGWLRFSGLTFEQSLGVGWLRAVDPADQLMLAGHWRDAMMSGAPFEAEFRMVGAAGVANWFLSRAVAQRDRQGRVLKWVGAITDVTSRHEHLENLRLSEARFRRLFDANLFGVVFWSESGELIEANDAFLGMLGYGRADLDAGLLQDLKLPRDEAARAADDSRAALTPYESGFRHCDGRHVPVMIAGADSPGEAGERFTVVVDLSEREARERFEQEFLADVAHDLRNPLAATKAQAQVMRRRHSANRLERDALEEGLNTIIANSTRMARRIEELTDVAQLRAGHALELMREPVDLVALIENTAEVYRQATERQEIQVSASEPALTGQLDASRIERVLDNLLSNAVKYSPRGGPIIAAVSREIFQGRECARISITDHGVGIPDSDRQAIFERFRRGSNVKGRMGGSGIGLAGARTIVEQHGGAITVESELGRGSTFTVHLPLMAPEPDGTSTPEGSGG